MEVGGAVGSGRFEAGCLVGAVWLVLVFHSGSVCIILIGELGRAVLGEEGLLSVGVGRGSDAASSVVRGLAGGVAGGLISCGEPACWTQQGVVVSPELLWVLCVGKRGWGSGPSSSGGIGMGSASIRRVISL